MSVPDTNNFTLQDVVNEIGSGDDLVEEFSLANASGFDPAYEGSKDRLYNFRNYTHASPFVNDPESLYFDASANPCSDFYIYITTGRNWYIVLDESEMDLGVYPSSGSGDDTITVFLYSYNYDTWTHIGNVFFYDYDTDEYLGSTTIYQYGIYDSCY